ncbi:hypothetical protein EV200_104378 [Pedobacter psychrotolerans]|uniref:Lipoprotein n=1 Tax=Pedobacter psychrotolerans TaxID=1843235 RepID=A0A4R2HGA6_9SPHI|nr:hypothetical protein [Pedobacter psychrotolerans]TCO25340.1 hypothetical protein EV200_104378 [Pedobacter psychrotolerans]GGE46319.1 hypothetical protein GCM10011413_10450 [Pedobacter psychrotolerans]
MKKLFVLTFYLLAISSCTAPNADKKQVLDKNNDQNTVQDNRQKFTEGKIEIEITTPGTSLGEIFRSVDSKKGNVRKQLENAIKLSSPKTKLEFESISNKNPMMLLNLMLLPWKSSIFLKPGKATAKFDALTYHGENTVDDKSGHGTFFISTQDNKNQKITFTYQKNELGKAGIQSTIRSEDYTIEKTPIIENIAGFTCKKSIYTLKHPGNANNPRLVSNSLTVAKIEVWSSDQMPSSVNFLNPLYINEKGGIMKLKVFYTTDEHVAIIYRFKKVEATKISPEEMKIQQSSPVYNYSKDAVHIASQVMGILFKI